MGLELRALTLKDEDAFEKGRKLFSDMDDDWFSFVYREGLVFEEHIKILEDRFNGINLPEGRVPDSMLYAFLNGEIIGRSSVRHELNEFLLKRGGHIGYAVATPFQGKGLATEILKQTLTYCKNVLHLNKVLITCNEENVPSWKVIEKNGGVLENKVSAQEDGKAILVRRYWVNL